MKHIRKNHTNEPASLRNFRETTPNTSYNGLPSDIKQAIRTALWREQGYICVYCMGRIDALKDSMEIEHFITQNRHPLSQFTEQQHRDRALRHDNFLGTCSSRKCSAIRGNIPLTVNPMLNSCEVLVRFRKDGRAYSNNPIVDAEIKDVLKLNLLSELRRVVIDKARENLIKSSPDNKWNQALIQQEIEKWTTRKNTRYGLAFEPYCMAAVHYLKSKI